MITLLTEAAQRNCQLWVADAVRDWFRADYMHVDYVQSRLPNTIRRIGRAVILFYTVDSHRLVMRSGTRGGWMHSVLKDRYLRVGKKRRRCARELVLLEKMLQMGLPVAEPIAAMSEQVGVFYRYRIVTREIPGARSLTELLRFDNLPDSAWMKVGATIARFHRAGVFHADLNASNIMLDRQGDVYLVDFDRGHIKRKAGVWRQNNLHRLRRSLEKLRCKEAGFHYDPVNFDRMMKAYSVSVNKFASDNKA